MLLYWEELQCQLIQPMIEQIGANLTKPATNKKKKKASRNKAKMSVYSCYLAV